MCPLFSSRNSNLRTGRVHLLDSQIHNPFLGGREGGWNETRAIWSPIKVLQKISIYPRYYFAGQNKSEHGAVAEIQVIPKSMISLIHPDAFSLHL